MDPWWISRFGLPLSRPARSPREHSDPVPVLQSQGCEVLTGLSGRAEHEKRLLRFHPLPPYGLRNRRPDATGSDEQVMTRSVVTSV